MSRNSVFPLLSCAFLALALSSLAACSAAAEPTSQSSGDESALEAARRHAPSCTTQAQCLKAFDDHTWVVSQAQQDACVANHDFPDVCVSCNTTRHVCEYHTGF